MPGWACVALRHIWSVVTLLQMQERICRFVYVTDGTIANMFSSGLKVFFIGLFVEVACFALQTCNRQHTGCSMCGSSMCMCFALHAYF